MCLLSLSDTNCMLGSRLTLSNDVSHESFRKILFFCPTGVVAILKIAATEVRADFGDGHPSFFAYLRPCVTYCAGFMSKNDFSTGPCAKTSMTVK